MAQRTVAYGDLVTFIPGLWVNPRSHTALDPKSLSELADDIKLRGQQDPFKVQRVRIPGKDEVIELVLDGQRRFKAAAKAGFKKDDGIMVIDMTDEIVELDAKSSAKLLIDILAVGTFREGLSSFEQSAAAETLKASGKSLGEIGRAIKRSDAWVSLMLKARKNATEQLLEDWRLGKVTDEQFKNLAEIKVASEQKKALVETIELREKPATNGTNGHGTSREGKAEARAHTAELAAKFREEGKKEKAAAKAAKAKPSKKVETKKAAPERHPPSKALIQELVDLSKKRLPTADYMKGMMDCARYVLGEIGPEKFGKPWRVFLARIHGSSFTVVEKKPAKKKSKKK